MNILDILICFLLFVFIVIYFAYNKPISYYIIPSERDPNFKPQTKKILDTTNWYEHAIKEAKYLEDADISIRLANRDVMNRWHKKTEYYPSGKEIRFSITTQGPNKKPEIYIDEENWLYGVPESGLTLDEYRKYVIKHEFMHGLGYDHQPCNSTTAVNGVCPVLYQSTRGCPKGFKCGYNILPVDFSTKLNWAYL